MKSLSQENYDTGAEEINLDAINTKTSDSTEKDELESLLDQYQAEATAATNKVLAKQKRGGAGRVGMTGMVRGREEGLATPLASDNKGYKLLQKMGFKAGQGIGLSTIGPTEPLQPEIRDKKGGLGIHEGRKRQREQKQFHQQQEAVAKARQDALSCEQYKTNNREAFMRRELMKVMHKAWRALEQLECQALDQGQGLEPLQDSLPGVFGGLQPPPPSVRTVQLLLSLPALWVPISPEESTAQGLGKHEITEECADTSLSPEDHSSLDEQSQLLLTFLRQNHNYCIFCGCSYDSLQQLEECCPGTSLEDH